jgi:GTP cyclohydrolase I
MKDIQNQLDHRRIDIQKVGVKTITYPITVLDKAQSSQKTVATINMYVNLPHQFKGTHMSRFIEILNRYHGKIDIRQYHLILDEMKHRLDAESAHLEMIFPFFLQRTNGQDTLQIRRYDCAMHCFLEKEKHLRLDIKVPVAAHPTGAGGGDREAPAVGLWGNVLVRVRFNRFMWLEDLIDIVEDIILTEAGFSPDGSVRKPVETLLDKLERTFARLPELAWYEITVEDESQGYSLFARASSTDDTQLPTDVMQR